MSDKLQKKAAEVYQFASLAQYPFTKRLAIRLTAFGFYIVISLIGKTLKFEEKGAENNEAIKKSGKVPIYTIWHNRIFGGTFWMRGQKIVVITSQSFDGEYIARFLIRFGFGAIRGSSTRGGIGALIEMIRLMRIGLPMAFTVDGPKGPKYVVKPGIILLAKKTGNPIMPLSFEFEKFWTIKSWDNLKIPKPFSRAVSYCAAPIYVAENAGETEIEKKRTELQNKLDELVTIGKQWRESFTKQN